MNPHPPSGVEGNEDTFENSQQLDLAKKELGAVDDVATTISQSGGSACPGPGIGSLDNTISCLFPALASLPFGPIQLLKSIYK